MDVSNTRTPNLNLNEKREKLGIVAGVAIGLSPIGIATISLIKPLNDKRIARNKKFLSKFFTEIDSFSNIKKYADDAILNIKSKTKGIKLEIIKPENYEKFNPIKKKSENSIMKFFYQFHNNINKMFANGLNACYRVDRNAVWINDKNLYSTVFHELGHGLNYHSKATKPFLLLHAFCQGTFPLVAISGLGLGIFKGSKSNTQVNEKSKKEIAKDFIKNNVGKLIFLYSLPIVGEELVASLRGFNLAKKYLTIEQQKIHIKNQMMGLISYMLLPGLVAGGVSLGIYVKNKISKPSPENLKDS